MAKDYLEDSTTVEVEGCTIDHEDGWSVNVGRPTKVWFDEWFEELSHNPPTHDESGTDDGVRVETGEEGDPVPDQDNGEIVLGVIKDPILGQYTEEIEEYELGVINHPFMNPIAEEMLEF